MDVLDIGGKASFNDIITEYEYHNHTPYSNTGLSQNDEIRIPCHQSEVFTLPSESYLQIEGTLLEKENLINPAIKLVNNVVPFLFEEIRYELGGNEVTRIKDCGVTTTLRNYLLLDCHDKRLSSMGWDHESGTISIDENTGKFSFSYPLKYLLSIFEDYKKIILSVKQELVLLRSSSDVNAVVLPPDKSDFLLTLNRVEWKIPYIRVTDLTRLELLEHVNSNIPIEIPFRQWELHQFPSFPQTKHQVWSVKSSSGIEIPRYVIVAFHSGRRGKVESNMSKFDHNDMGQLRLFLNNKYFPYIDQAGDILHYYGQYARFKSSYNCDLENGPLLTLSEFKTNASVFVIDASRQPDVLKSSQVDIRLEFRTEKNIPANTYAYCLIVYDVIYQYFPLNGIVQKVL
jgi:hypothetical protein